jgi:transglutaminase-like putative cysteine protease
VLYDIKLRVAYEYASPTASNRNLVRIFPLELPGLQRPIVTELSISPRPAERSLFLDFFGNPVQDVFIREPHSELEIRVQSRVERLAGTFGDTDVPLGELRARVSGIRSLAAEAPHHFLGRSPRVRPSTALREWATAHVRPDMPASEAVRALGRALRAQMAFDPEATSVETTHEEAFALRRGVCQDFTHILIATLRSIGVPAGYVSGVLRTIPPAGKERLSGADAMHAWVRAWCGPEAGWFEYDPTNSMDAGADHVAFARGRDYFDVSPVKGVMRTSGEHETEQQIDVIEVGTPAAT